VVWRRYSQKASSATSVATATPPGRAAAIAAPALAVLDAHGRAADEPRRLLADGVHLLLADVGEEDELPGVLVALLAHAHRQVHLGQLALDAASQLAQRRRLVAGIGVGAPQRLEVLPDFGDRAVVRLQVAGVAGEQESARSGLGIEHVLQQAIERAAGVEFARHVVQRGGERLCPASLMPMSTQAASTARTRPIAIPGHADRAMDFKRNSPSATKNRNNHD
jgi:hypothetical protein